MGRRPLIGRSLLRGTEVTMRFVTDGQVTIGQIDS
jgi:hypothetical protein